MAIVLGVHLLEALIFALYIASRRRRRLARQRDAYGGYYDAYDEKKVGSPMCDPGSLDVLGVGWELVARFSLGAERFD